MSPSPQPASSEISGWKNYTITPLNLSFQYPPDLEIAKDIQNSTALAADDEYWVVVEGSDVLYLQFFLYRSNKSPGDWWNTDGKSKFEKLADEIEGVINPKPTINLTYKTNPTIFVGKEALNVTVSSNYSSPNTPEQRFITIFQQNGYIVMVSYYDQGTTKSSIDTSKQILSTFKFTN